MENINRVTITGNLTADPEVREANGTPVATLRLAVNGRRKDGNGKWVDKPNYFNVIVWGSLATICGQHLGKGRPVAIDGRLDYREWEAKDGSGRRSAVEIVADIVQFLGTANANGNGNGNGTAAQNQPANQQPVAAATAGGIDDDIPF